MPAGKITKTYRAVRSSSEGVRPSSLELIGEEPLSIRVDDKPYAVVMRTPGEEEYHGAGFCLGEGIVDTPDDFKRIGYDEHLDSNVIDFWLTPERRKQIPDVLKRQAYVSQTSCGICGKAMIADLCQKLTPAKDGFKIDLNRIFDCIDALSKNQNHYKTTRGSHAALILDDQLAAISFAEDVGRHNALDKAIGKAFMNDRLSKARVLVLSSRNSHELVQKAARARLPMMISNSRPTALAVEMGQALNMTLAFPDGNALVIPCGQHRLCQTSA